MIVNDEDFDHKAFYRIPHAYSKGVKNMSQVMMRKVLLLIKCNKRFHNFALMHFCMEIYVQNGISNFTTKKIVKSCIDFTKL